MTRITSLIKNEHLRALEKAELGVKKNVQRIREEKYQSLVRSEFQAVLKEAEERAPNISQKLETMRKKLIGERKLSEFKRGSENHRRPSMMERRIPIETVSRMIDIPVNELALHFLNGHRNHEGYDLVEYRLGGVYFYGDTTGEVK